MPADNHSTRSFFDSVRGPIRRAAATGSGDVEAGEGLRYQVYDPDRIVAGKRMEDHLRIAVCYWHSFNWPGSDVFGAGTFDRPWLERRRRPDGRGFAKQDAAFEFFAKLGTPFYCFHDVDMAPPRAQRCRKSQAQPRRAGRPGRREDRPRPASGCCGARPTCSATPVTPPGRRPTPTRMSSPTPPPRSATMLDATHRLGGENYVLWGGREGYETLLNTRLRQEADQFARFLDDGRRAQAQDRIHGHVADRAQAPGADQAPVRLRLRHRPRLPRALRPRSASTRSTSRSTTPRSAGTRSITRWPTPSTTASSAASMPTVATRRTAGTPTSSRTRSMSCRWRCTRSCAAAASPPEASTSTPSFAARVIDRTDLFHGHIGGIDTLARALLRGRSPAGRRNGRTGPRRPVPWLGQRTRSADSGRQNRSRRAGRRCDQAIARSGAGLGSAGVPREPGQPGDLVRPPLIGSVAPPHRCDAVRWLRRQRSRTTGPLSA